MLASTLNLLRKELRAWNHRLWWLPVAGALFLIVPMAWSQPPRLPTPDEWQQRSWMMRQLMLSTIPAQPFAILVGLLALGSMLLSGWLARASRCQEVHDDTLTDLALTPIRALELTIAQIVGAWLVTMAMLVGALPVLVYYATIAGRSGADIALALGSLIVCPLFGAALGQTTMWWKRLVLASVRGKSFRFFFTWITFAALGLCVAVAWPLAWPLAVSISRSPNTDDFGFQLMVGAISLVWGLPAVCVIYLQLMALHAAACSLRRGARGIVSSALLIAFVVVSLRLSAQFIAATQKWAGLGTAAMPVEYGLLGAVVLFPFVITPYLLGGQLMTTELTSMIAPGMHTGLLLGVGYWFLVGLSSLVFAARDLNWTLTNAWSIACIQNPTRAALLAPEAERKPKRREFFYPFPTRNPVYDLCLARSMGTRVAMIALFGLSFQVGSLFVWTGYSDYRKRPLDNQLDASYSVPLLLAILLGACCGMSCGLTIARLKRTQQWPALLVTPLRFRSLLFGVCAPRWGDAMFLTLLSALSMVMPWTLRLIHGNDVSEGFLLCMALAVYVATMSSIFSSAFTKSPAKTVLLGIVVVALSFTAYGFFSAAIEHRFFPYRADRTRWQEFGAFIIATPLLLAGVSTLAGIGARRLRWER